jgi:hypothetical protein
MAFSLFVESLNLRARKKSAPKIVLYHPYTPDPPTRT